MKIKICIAMLSILFSQVASAKEYKSQYGFSYNLPDEWVVVTKDDIKRRFKNNNFADFGLEYLDKKNAIAFLKQIKDGRVEYIYSRTHSSKKLRNSINIQRKAGRTAMTKEAAEKICKAMPKQLIKMFGKKAKVNACGLRMMKGVPYFYYEYTGQLPDAFSVLYNFQLSPNVTLVLQGFGLNANEKPFKKDVQQVAHGLAGYINKSPDYFGLLRQAITAFKKGNLKVARKNLQVLADIGDRDGQYNLGVMYVKGMGVKKDIKKGVEWFRRAASQGHVGGLNNLAFAYLNGEGVEKDVPKAARLFGLAARAGLPMSQNMYGIMLINGMGTTKNVKQGVEWLFAAASQQYMPAVQNLIKYFTPQAQKGDKRAMHNLGLLYIQSNQADKGVPWLEKASKAGFKKSTDVLKMLREKKIIK